MWGQARTGGPGVSLHRAVGAHSGFASYLRAGGIRAVARSDLSFLEAHSAAQWRTIGRTGEGGEWLVGMGFRFRPDRDGAREGAEFEGVAGGKIQSVTC